MGSMGAFITGIGFCAEPPADIETIKPVKTVIEAEALALSAVSHALKQRGNVMAEDCAVIFGVDNAVDSCKAQFFKGLLRDGPLGASPLLFPFTSHNAIAARVTIAFGIKGECITIASGPLSFLLAVDYCIELLAGGIVKSAVAGGISERAAMALIIEAAGAIENGRRVSVQQMEQSEQMERVLTIEDSFQMVKNAISNRQPLSASDRSGNGVSLDFK